MLLKFCYLYFLAALNSRIISRIQFAVIAGNARKAPVAPASIGISELMSRMPPSTGTPNISISDAPVMIPVMPIHNARWPNFLRSSSTV